MVKPLLHWILCKLRRVTAKRLPKEPLVILTAGAISNTKSYAVYAVRFDLAMRFAPANPAMADINNQAAAGSGTAETVAVTLEPSRP